MSDKKWLKKLVRYVERKKQYGKPLRRWVDDIKIYVNKLTN
jgi:hypothetical protein